MATLERAIAIAVEAHAGQLDKGGSPYIFHPLRVMMQLDRREDQIVAVLHDVLEDSETSPEFLREAGFSEEILTALTALTRNADEPYTAFIKRIIAAGPLASRVKFYDVSDNMDLRRIPNLTQKDRDRVEERYRPALWQLWSAFPDRAVDPSTPKAASPCERCT